MKLFTEIPIESTNSLINHHSKILAIGSCFAAEMGELLSNSGFQVQVNPFGTQFHPLAIEQTFDRIYGREHYTPSEIFFNNGLYFSWDHSATFSNPKREEILANINNKIDDANNFLSEATHIIFTLGTAWAYYLRKAEFYVSNCHKVPQKHFDKVLLPPDIIYKSIRNLVLKVKDVRPNAHIIFTISPVRHIRDGYRENNVSKGVLHFSLHKILNEFPEIHYFPSYELAMDELRDYRYYAEDLAHLNDLGVKYIWGKFSLKYFSTETLTYIKNIENIKKAVKHRPINPESANHKKFLYDTYKKALEIRKNLYPEILEKEINILKEQQSFTR